MGVMNICIFLGVFDGIGLDERVLGMLVLDRIDIFELYSVVYFVLVLVIRLMIVFILVLSFWLNRIWRKLECGVVILKMDFFVFMLRMGLFCLICLFFFVFYFVRVMIVVVMLSFGMMSFFVIFFYFE